MRPNTHNECTHEPKGKLRRMYIQPFDKMKGRPVAETTGYYMCGDCQAIIKMEQITIGS